MLNHPVFENFKRISQIPRPSGQEDAVRAYLQGWANAKGFSHQSDDAGNLVVYVPAHKAKPLTPTIILQSHMDMVCEKTPESEHNFESDPLNLYVDSEWLRAKDTSLGADNGIGMAYAMTAAESDFPHPPLELLFTVDEERGLTGALELSPELLKGGIMFNMDSEEEETLIIGCASGRSRRFGKQYDPMALPENMTIFKLSVTNLLGGHSGIEIHKQNANANKLICGFLSEIENQNDLQLLRYHGGSAMNAIPRDAQAIFAVQSAFENDLRAQLKIYEIDMQAAYPQETLELKLCKMSTHDAALSPADTRNFLDLMLLLPHGALRRDLSAPLQTETSCNLGPVSLEKGYAEALVFIRSSNDKQGLLLAEQCHIAARLTDYTVTIQETDTGAWQPHWNAPLLLHCKGIYKQVFEREPKIEVIHAGLECGVIIAKYPGIEAISLGPTQFGAHSPSECLNILSTLRIWDFLQAVLKSYA